MSNLLTLIKMQLKDKLEINFKNTKEFLRKILFFVLKFLIVGALSFVIIMVIGTIGFTHDQVPNLLTVILLICLALSILSSMGALMKNLFFSLDNRVLITLPVKPNQIFISKLVVYYLYELRRNCFFTIPITVGIVLLLITRGMVAWPMLIWALLVMIIVTAITVLIGGLLSIVAMYVYRFIKQHSVLEVLVFLTILVGMIALAIYLINLIPENIDLVGNKDNLLAGFRKFISDIADHLFISKQLVYTLIGDKNVSQKYVYTLLTAMRFGIMLVAVVALFFLNYLISRPLFFKMMSKNFETTKKGDTIKANKIRGKHLTFINKEFTINLRSIDISINYLMIYIVVPILTLLLNRVFMAMDTRTFGDLLICAFNVLLILLPLLASNALVATYYSKEGKAGSLKKTKPIYALYPLFVKMLFNMLFSLPSVIICVIIFGRSIHLGVLSIIFMSMAILAIHYGHMIYSATLDIMNPQNEQYATTGEVVDNPNETKSTIMAFVCSALFAVVGFWLLKEASFNGEIEVMGSIKFLAVALIFCGSLVFLFIKKVRAYYYYLED